MENGDEEYCNTRLCLGLGMGGGGHVSASKKEKKQKVHLDLLAFELCPKGEAINNVVVSHHNNKADKFISLERSIHANSTDSDNNNTNNNNNNNSEYCRKKLRLTKEQSAMLESTFKLHNTLNPVQKQALADQLNLKTRQIEVWFQNRRARTKLKQTEVDYELLKKHCQNLSEENRRLKKEIQDLRALKIGPSPLCIQLSKATTITTVCSSCDKLLKVNELGKNN